MAKTYLSDLSVENIAEAGSYSFNNNANVKMEEDTGNLKLSDTQIQNLNLEEIGNPEHANVHYVAANGSDGIANGSIIRPYQTIAAAVSGAGFGDVIYVGPGIYTEPQVVLSNGLTIIGASEGTVEIQNGFSYTSAASENTDLTIVGINTNDFDIDVSAATNGTINLKAAKTAITRSDNNPNVLVVITESLIFTTSISGGTNTINESLIVSTITQTNGNVLCENCKFVSTAQISGAAVFRTLDCSLFGAAHFVNGTVNVTAPTWETDLSTEYLGGFTGTVNKVLLASIQSTDISDFETAVENITLPVYNDMKEPTGFIDRTSSTLSFDEGTRTLSVTPVSGSFEIYIKGVKQSFSSTLTKQIPDTTGNYFFYIDSNGDLDYFTTFNVAILSDYAYTAYLYWNSSDAQAVSFGEERHGITMDGVTHGYLHTTRGTQLVSGASINYTLGDGSLDADAQIALTDMQIKDEDITVNIQNSATPSQPFQQKLSPIAEIPIYYRDGATAWRKYATSKFPLIPAPDRVYYNENVAGSWQLTEAPSNNKFCVTYVFATTNLSEPVIGLLGQNVYQNVDEAREQAAWDQITFGDLPAQEMKLLYILYYETSSSYANDANAKIVYVSDTRFSRDREVSATAFNGDHANLSGLGNDDHPQYLLIDGSRPMSGNFDMGGFAIIGASGFNGVSDTEISYVSGVTSPIQTQLDSKVDDSLLGAVSGVATLDANGRLPLSQLTKINFQAGERAANTFTGNPKKSTVTLSETMPNTSYSVFMTGTTDARPFTVESKTTTTFVINTNSNQAMTGTVDWQVIAHGAL
jgi:hypothetical protein